MAGVCQLRDVYEQVTRSKRSSLKLFRSFRNVLNIAVSCVE